MDLIVENPNHLRDAEIIVGIPSYNEADSISYPTDKASRGLIDFFPDKKSVIINVDNNSQDKTKETFLNTPTKVPKIYISTPLGVRGKGNNLRNLFEASVALRARALVLVDADLKSITPQWIQYLAEPLFAGFDYVSPIYVRHKYDGSITNHIAYPLLRTLFGLRVRQPIGGDFGISGRMARVFLSEKLWNERISNFGIDIWMTTISIARRFQVCQTFLGSPKSHRVKDPAKDLNNMFTHVIMTLFDLMIDFEYIWKETTKSSPSSIYGFGFDGDEQPQSVALDTVALHQSFISGFERFGEIWNKIIPRTEMLDMSKTQKCPTEKFYFTTDLWARILFNYAIAYRNNEIPREQIIESMIPFYHSRVLSFANRTRQMNTMECEQYFERINRVFENEKHYLIKRWDEDQNKLGYKLFND